MDKHITINSKSLIYNYDYFDNKTTKQETVELIKQHTRNYCKRQLTFMKTINNLELLNIKDAKNRIEEFLNDSNR